MEFVYKIFRGLRKICMIALPIGVVLTVVSFYSDNYNHKTSASGAVYFIFLVLLPILIILTKVPNKNGEISASPTKIERTMVIFAKIVMYALIAYLIVLFVIGSMMQGG